jgi:hypothetical protein
MKPTTAALAILVAVTLIAGTALASANAASAQEPTPAAPPPHSHVRLDNFLQKLADNLNISLDQLKAKIQATELQIVDDLASDGTITADQAQQLKDKVNAGGGVGLGQLLAGARRKHGGARAGAYLARLRAGVVASAATAIGMDVADLKAELKDGKSIADVAAEHGVGLDTVKAQIVADATAALGQAVQDGKIDQARSDAILEKLNAGLDAILGKKVERDLPPDNRRGPAAGHAHPRLRKKA